MKKSEILRMAMHNYDNCQCICVEDFHEDMKCLKKVNKYISSQCPVTTRQCLNNIIVSFNLFGVAAVTLLYASVEREMWGRLTSYLTHLNRLPEDFIFEGISINTDHPVDVTILQFLKTL